jgi:Family of unknown function (DUF5924)/Protein of unknown function (DUF2914)
MARLKIIGCKLIQLSNRFPWALPLFGFVSGVASFFLVERKQEEFAQAIAALMLVGWVWLMLEPLLTQLFGRWFKCDIPPVALRYITQLMHQESLCFVIPFFVLTTAWNTGQAVFTGVLIVALIVSITDYLYYSWLAPRRWLYFIFHGVTLFAVLVTTLPLLFQMPTPKSYLLALLISTVLTSIGAMLDNNHHFLRKAVVATSLIVFVSSFGYCVRPWVPPASIWLTRVAITDQINDETKMPDRQLKRVSIEQLRAGLFAFTAIHAPRGLNEKVFHRWTLNGKLVDQIAIDIQGGREEGYRAWTRKTNFPENPAGNWTISVLTEGNQLIGVLRFKVSDDRIKGIEEKPSVELDPVNVATVY